MKHRFSNVSVHWFIPVLALFLTALPVSLLSTAAEEPSDPSDTETEEPAVVSSFGKAEGVAGDIMKASFMEFRVNEAALTDQYQSLTPDEGMKLLVVNVTTHATQKKPLVLYDTDYQIQWNGEGELDYSEPVTYRDEWADFAGYNAHIDLNGIEGMFPGTGILASDEIVTYDYVYQVPQDASGFRLLFKEYFEDESLGDLFIVSINANDTPVIEGTLGTIEPLSGEGAEQMEAAAAEEAPAAETSAEAGQAG